MKAMKKSKLQELHSLNTAMKSLISETNTILIRSYK